MTDTMTTEQRHRCMSRIRAKDTKPELIVRRWLWEHGYRYRLHVRRLPGTPDIVMRKHKTAIFINGCFWHGHNTQARIGGELTDSTCCRVPTSHRDFWLKKINRNIERDKTNQAALKAAGWHVITIWECELTPRRRKATLDALLVRLTRLFWRKPPTYGHPGEIAPSVAAEPDVPYSSTCAPAPERP